MSGKWLPGPSPPRKRFHRRLTFGSHRRNSAIGRIDNQGGLTNRLAVFHPVGRRIDGDFAFPVANSSLSFGGLLLRLFFALGEFLVRELGSVAQVGGPLHGNVGGGGPLTLQVGIAPGRFWAASRLALTDAVAGPRCRGLEATFGREA